MEDAKIHLVHTGVYANLGSLSLQMGGSVSTPMNVHHRVCAPMASASTWMAPSNVFAILVTGLQLTPRAAQVYT